MAIHSLDLGFFNIFYPMIVASCQLFGLVVLDEGVIVVFMLSGALLFAL